MSGSTFRVAESLKKGNLVKGYNGRTKIVREVEIPSAGQPAQPDDIVRVTFHDGIVHDYKRGQTVAVADVREEK